MTYTFTYKTKAGNRSRIQRECSDINDVIHWINNIKVKGNTDVKAFTLSEKINKKC